MTKVCNCGSGKETRPIIDGHGIFLTYACNNCRAEKLSHFRPDIFDKYETDEPIEPED